MNDAYRAAHSRCPKCGLRELETTTMATIYSDRDTNRARCICGWIGIVHDLIPSTPEESADELARLSQEMGLYDHYAAAELPPDPP